MRVLTVGVLLALLVAAPAGASEAVPRPAPVVGAQPMAAPLPPPPGTTSLLSTSRAGSFPNGGSIEPSMSTSGRYVAFTSIASDLVENDEADTIDVFVVDRRSGRTTRAPRPVLGSVQLGGSATEPSISGDGRIVAYSFQTGTTTGIAGRATATFVVAWDRQTGAVDFVSRNSRGTPQAGASQPSVSGDGRYVAYSSTFDWPGDTDDGQADVFRYDRRTDKTLQLSVGFNGEPISGGADAPSISGDGKLVAFVSDGGDSVVNADTGSEQQVYLRDVPAQRTEEISVPVGSGPPNGIARDPAISADGRYVAFLSGSTNLVTGPAAGSSGLFRRDRQTGTTILVSVRPDGAAAKGSSSQPSITPDGRMIAFVSTASDLVPETAGRVAPAAISRLASEVFIRDIDAGETVLVSVSRQGGGSGGRSIGPSVGGGGRYIAFASDSTTLVRGDGNETFDVFLRDLPPSPVINPATLNLGAATVGTESLPLAATLANGGWSPLTVDGASLTGGNKGDFRVVADGCAGRRLARNEACSVTVVFAPTAKGPRTTTLAVADSFAGSPRTVRLTGRAAQPINARLTLDPPLGPPGIVTIAEGTGFPPGAVVRLSWSQGITPHLRDVTADAKGRFRIPVLVFHNDRTGQRELQAEAVAGTGFAPVRAPMLVTRGSVVPPRFDIVRIIDLPLVLVIRG